MNRGSLSGHSSYHGHTWYGDTAAILLSGRGNWPMTEISSDATGRGLTAFLVGMVAMGQLESSTSGGGLARTLPLPFHPALGPSSDELNDHSLVLYWCGEGGGGSSLSLTHLAGGESPTERAPVDGLIVNRLEGGGLSTFLLVDDKDDLVIELAGCGPDLVGK